MATSIFDDKAIIPDDSMVACALADQMVLWDSLKSHVMGNVEDINQGWKYYSKKSGWTLIFKKKDRTLFYFVPCSGYFRIGFVFGEKAVRAAEKAPVPEHIIETILAAAAHVEGRSFFVDIKDKKDLEIVFTLLKIKEEI